MVADEKLGLSLEFLGMVFDVTSFRVASPSRQLFPTTNLIFPLGHTQTTLYLKVLRVIFK